jgi:hypothetical protein
MGAAQKNDSVAPRHRGHTSLAAQTLRRRTGRRATKTVCHRLPLARAAQGFQQQQMNQAVFACR